MNTDELTVIHRIVRAALILYVMAIVLGTALGFMIGYIVQRLVG